MGRPRRHNPDKPEYIVEACGYLDSVLALAAVHFTQRVWNGHELVAENPRTWNTKTAHRMYWEAPKRPSPDGLELDHLCKVRHCVNPDHLELVTHTVNVRRGSKCALRLELREAVAGSTEPTRILAGRYGVSYSAINRARRGFKGNSVRVAPFKLPKEARQVIAESTEPTAILAARYGVCSVYIQRIRKAAREGWLPKLFSRFPHCRFLRDCAGSG